MPRVCQALSRQRLHCVFESVPWRWTSASPISLPFIPSGVREEWHCGIKGFQSVLCLTSSVLCYAELVHCFLLLFLSFLPQQLCCRYNPLHPVWPPLPKHTAAQGHNLQCKGSTWEDAGGMSVLNSGLRIGATARRFSTCLLTYWDKLQKTQVIFTLLFFPSPP